MRDLAELFNDGDVPIFSRDEIAEVLAEMEDRVVSARAFAEGAEFRYGVDHSEVAYYSGAWAIALELVTLMERRLGLRPETRSFATD